MSVEIKPLVESDLGAADRIVRIAFGRFLGLPDDVAMAGDTDFVSTRWRAAPASALGAYHDGVLVGTNFVARWGSVGFFGPLTVQPEHWGKGYATPLIRAAMDLFQDWQTESVGLYTFAQSPKHIRLYQKFDFWPRLLTAIMSRQAEPIARPEGCALDPGGAVSLNLISREEYAALTRAIHPGLDLSIEIDSLRAQKLGEVVVLRERGELVAMAVCHLGPGTEAGSGICYVKFGGVLPGPEAGGRFERLLDACSWLASRRGYGKVLLGINTACRDAYHRALAHGFRAEMQGVAMHRNDQPAFYRPDAYVICDWR
jgi:GNAT superfamily N-acetyltransferase